MMRSFVLLVALVSLAASQRVRLPPVTYPREPDRAKWTALDKYVMAPDDFAGYTPYPKTYKGRGWTAYVLSFTSQAWKASVSSRPVWQHWLTVCVPDKTTHTTAAMYMDGPDNSPTPQDTLYFAFDMMCSAMHGVVAYLQQIPNQPLAFPDHPDGLTEDDLIAYGWRKFLNGSAVDPEWLLRLPMTKAGVNAMTAVQLYIAKNHAQIPPIKDFLVCGASKRGWTAWTVAAVDR
jgi:PhoPQ-activated pathogenicity-related protein